MKNSSLQTPGTPPSLELEIFSSASLDNPTSKTQNTSNRPVNCRTPANNTDKAASHGSQDRPTKSTGPSIVKADTQGEVEGDVDGDVERRRRVEGWGEEVGGKVG